MTTIYIESGAEIPHSPSNTNFNVAPVCNKIFHLSFNLVNDSNIMGRFVETMNKRARRNAVNVVDTEI